MRVPAEDEHLRLRKTPRPDGTQEVAGSIFLPSDYNECAMTDDDLRRLFESHSAEIRRHFDVSTEQVKHEVRLVAEGLGRVDERLDRTANDIRDEMRRGFGDTRVERLEASTH